MKRETKLIKNTAIIGLGLLCTKGISFLLLPLYTALLSTSDYGTVDLVFTLVSLITFTLSLQFEQGILRFLIDCRGNKEEQKKYISTTFLFITAVAAVGLLITIIICRLVNYKYTLYLVLNIIANLYASISVQVARGFDKTVTYTFASFLAASSYVIFNVLFITVFKWNIGGMLTSFIIGNVICTVYVFIKCKVFSYIRIKSFDKNALKELLKYSVPIVPNTLCWWLVGCSDRLIITHFLGAGPNGIYAVANKFPTLFAAISRVFQISWTENAAESSNTEDRDKYYSKVMNQSICIMINICTCLLAVLPLVFKFLINSRYSESYMNILILLIAAIFCSWSNLYVSLFGAIKYTKSIVFTTVFAAAVNILVNIVFIKRIGLFAASLSTLAAYMIITLVSHIIISKKASIKYSATDLIISFSALATASASYCIKNTILSLIVTVAAVALTFFKNKNIIIPVMQKTLSPIMDKINKQ